MAGREAVRLHDGLRRSIGALFPRIEGTELEDRPGYRVLVCPRIAFPGFNGLWIDGPDDLVAPTALAAAIDQVEGHGVPCWAELRAKMTPAIEQAIRALGFTQEEVVPGMVVRPDELIDVDGPELTFTQVAEPEGLLVAATLAAAGFEAPLEPFVALFSPNVAAAPEVSMYVAWSGAEPVSTATAWRNGRDVGIFNVATPPDHRGHGYGRAVTSRAVADGFASGADLAWLQASPLGEPIYRAMGFRPVATYLLLGRAPPPPSP